MFEVRIKGSNKNIECLSKNIQFSKNEASILNFEILADNTYFNRLSKFKDYIEVINLKTNEVVFDGRVISNNKSMSDVGLFINSIQCESVLNYLNDVYVEKWQFYPEGLPKNSKGDAFANFTTEKFISKVLDKYNSVVQNEKKIFLGNIEVVQPIQAKTNYQTCLNAIQSIICDNFDGYLIIRRENGINYLDFLNKSPVDELVKIEVAKNMKTLQINDSDINIFTRIIPFGKNGLDITKENNGCNYVQDDDLVAKYGIIETVMEWQNVTIGQELLNRAKNAFDEVKLTANQIQLTALDLSYINNEYNLLRLYTPVKVINQALNYDNVHEIVSISFDLYNPYLSTFSLDLNSTGFTNSVNSVCEQVNSNKLEIVNMGDALIDKVSNDQVSSIFEQTASEFQFIIGNDTPLTIDKNGLEMEFANKTYCELNSNGLLWKSQYGKFEYHCLCHTGSISNVPSNTTVTVRLPAEFEGKDYSISWWAGNVFLDNPNDLIFAINVEKITNGNPADGCIELKADLMVRNPEINQAPYWGGKMNIMWMAIA